MYKIDTTRLSIVSVQISKFVCFHSEKINDRYMEREGESERMPLHELFRVGTSDSVSFSCYWQLPKIRAYAVNCQDKSSFIFEAGINFRWSVEIDADIETVAYT